MLEKELKINYYLNDYRWAFRFVVIFTQLQIGEAINNQWTKLISIFPQLFKDFHPQFQDWRSRILHDLFLNHHHLRDQKVNRQTQY